MSSMPKYIFVSERLDDKNRKTASKFIAYRTWDTDELWFAEVVDDGNAFFVFQQGQRDKGHKDATISYITADRTKWKASIKNYVFFHSPEGDTSKGHEDRVIAYITGDGSAFVSSFAEWFEE